MWEWIRENKKIMCRMAIGIFVGIPLVVYGLSVLPVFPVGGNNDWAGFWGGYLGAIVGACVAIYVMRKTLENEEKRRREEQKERFLSEIAELVAGFAAQINKSNSHLLRFHSTGDNKWNYEALYELNEVTKVEHLLQIKLISQKASSYELQNELLNEILNVGKATQNLHAVNVKSFKELKKEADMVTDRLSSLMELTAKFIMFNEE